VGTGTITALDDRGSYLEIALDTEMVAAMAPRLSDIDVIYDPYGSLVDRLDATLNRSLIQGPMPKVVSYSGGDCEPTGSAAYSKVALEYALTEHILMDMAANGISFVVSAGDTGSSCNQAYAAIAGARLSVQFSASSPYATSAGGELIGLNSADSIQGQQVWDDLPLGSGLAGGGEAATAPKPSPSSARSTSGRWSPTYAHVASRSGSTRWPGSPSARALPLDSVARTFRPGAGRVGLA
jgi:subtilase family serine protease